MWADFQFVNLAAIVLVSTSLIALVYFLWKTLITSRYFQQGITFYQQKDYPGAEAAFRQVISMNTTNDVVRLLLGDALMQQDKIEEATQIFEDVVTRSPKNADAYLRLSNMLMRQDKKAEAISNLQQARDLFKKQRNPQKAEQIDQLLTKMK